MALVLTMMIISLLVGRPSLLSVTHDGLVLNKGLDITGRYSGTLLGVNAK